MEFYQFKSPQNFLDKIFNDDLENDPKTLLEINLLEQKISIIKSRVSEFFEINPYKKNNMLNGFDDIDYLINIKEQISIFAKKTPL